MGDPLKIVSAAMGLEVWAIGTPHELERLEAALCGIGTLQVPRDSKGRPDPTVATPLGGADRGRSRIYLRAHVRDGV